MSPIPSALGILGGRSPRDLAGRAVQVARAKLESVGVGDRGRASPESLLRAVRRAGVTGAEDLLGRFRTRVETTSLPAFRDPARTTSRLRARWPELGVRLLGRARAIEAGRFELLGHAALEFGDPIDWWLDPLDGRRAPDVHWSRVPYLDSTVVGDHKVVWELNRQHYLACLGQTAWLEDDDGWADVCFAHLDAWMTANPPKRGINWVSSLELAFRSIAWLWALHFFARSPKLDPDRFARIVAVLRAHGRHVEHYISTSFSPNTHLTGEALGLYYLGTMLPELPESERWRRRGKAWLMDALEFQIRPDGGYFEASIHYHRYTVDFYNHLLLLTRLFEGGAPEGLEVRLESIAEHLVAVTRLDGTTPLVGDDDGGRLVFLDDRPVADARSTILGSAVLLEREDWIAAADPPSEELVWLLGPEALDWVEERAGSRWDPESRALATTGFFVLRGRDTTRGDHALIRCGPHGALSGGHAHADALAIDLSLAGRPLLIDPGTASYTDPELRGWFRSSAAHNTVTLGGASSSEPSGPFGWSTKASSRLRAWRALRLVDFFEGEHDGFRRLGAGLSHERSVLYVRSGYWVVRDRIGVGAGEREPRAHFNFAPGLSVEPDDRTLRVLDADGAPFATITALGASTWEPCPGRAAPAYGRVLPAEAWAARSDRPSEVVSGIDGVAEIVTLISREGLPLEPIAESAGAAWRIGERGDLLVLTSRGRRTLTTDPGIETDFEWVWARRGSGRGWSAAFAHAGRRLRLAGGAPLELSETAGSIYVEGSGDASAPDLHVESRSPEVGTVVAAWFRDL